MSEKLWTAVEHYLNEKLVPPDTTLQAALRNNTAAGLPTIDVAPHEGKLLYLLAKMSGAKSILEIGTLGGYSTIWLARALPPEGTLITLEIDPKHAKVATENIALAGLSAKVEVRLGPLSIRSRTCTPRESSRSTSSSSTPTSPATRITSTGHFNSPNQEQ